MGKEFACDVGDAGLIPGSGRFPGGGNGNPLQYFEVFIEFVSILFLFFFFLITHEVCGTLASLPGIEPVPPALEGKVSTTGPTEKSLEEHFTKETKSELEPNKTHRYEKQSLSQL